MCQEVPFKVNNYQLQPTLEMDELHDLVVSKVEPFVLYSILNIVGEQPFLKVIVAMTDNTFC